LPKTRSPDRSQPLVWLQVRRCRRLRAGLDTPKKITAQQYRVRLRQPLNHRLFDEAGEHAVHAGYCTGARAVDRQDLETWKRTSQQPDEPWISRDRWIADILKASIPPCISNLVADATLGQADERCLKWSVKSPNP